MMRMRALVVCVTISFVLAGCATNKKWGNGAATGALIGGAIGGGAGVGEEYGRGFHESRQLGRGAAIGAGAGMILGALIGHFLWDEAQETRAAAPAPEAKPAAEATSAPMGEAPPPTEHKIVLRSVLFDFKRSDIHPDDRPALDDAVAVLKENPGVRVTIEGHTDNIGSEAYNMYLGRRRAEAVRDYLIEHGINRSQLEVISMDANQPVASNETEEGRAQNRRVELRLQAGAAALKPMP